MPVTAVRAGDVVGLPQRFANPNRHRFFPDIQIRQSRHQRAHIELVHLVFKLADHHHAPIDARPVVRFDAFNHLALIRGNGHWETPAIFAKTANTTAKSLSATPIPRAAVKNSFVTAVVGMGTSNCRPSSSASSMSFCIMLTLNHASSGIFSTNGPRYSTIGDAITLCVITSTKILPGFTPASIPSGPFITAANAAELVTMESVMSLALTTSLGVFAHFIPFLMSHAAFERVRLYPDTL